MHDSSWLKARFFVEQYLSGKAPKGERRRVLEIGSKSYEGQRTYRSLFSTELFDYTGLDVETGPDVEIVPKSPYVWPEIASNSFDVCISGQTFEHNPYFWVTFAEIARVLKPNGVAMIVAPGGGNVHRYPYDCWRFYPDAWLSLCSLTGMELAESYFESDDTAYLIPEGEWRDSMAIVRRPQLDGAKLEAFHSRLDTIVSPYRNLPFELSGASDAVRLGPAAAAYEQHVRATYKPEALKRVRRAIRARGKVSIYRSTTP